MIRDDGKPRERVRGRPPGCAGLLVAAMAVVAARDVVRVFDRGWSQYGEGSLLAIVERWRVEPAGPGWVAHELHAEPLWAGVLRGGVGAGRVTPWDHTLVPGRLVSCLAGLATAALLGVIARREGCSAEVAAFAPLAFLASPYVMSWTPCYRVDNLTVFFTVAAYAAAAGSSRRSWVAAAVLLAAGSLVKQTAVLAAVPIVAWLVIRRRFAATVAFAILMMGLTLAAWLAYDRATRGYAVSLGVRANLNSRSH